MYHSVVRDQTAAFEAELLYLKSRFSLTSLGDLIHERAANTSSHQPGASHRIALTFDDGLKNNFEVAYPVLQKHGIAATFFVCPGLIETGKWVWNYEARERLRSISPESFESNMRSGDVPTNDVESTIRWMKTLALEQRNAVEEHVRSLTRSFEPSLSQRDKSDLMSWQELRSLDQHLITIGSHTWDHPILPTLTAAECNFQLRSSKVELERRLERPVTLFCYPDGAMDANTVEATRQVYSAAVCTESRPLRATDDLFRLPRIPSGDDPAMTAWRLHQPDA